MFNGLIKRHGETVQIWGTSSGTDDLGNPVKTWDSDKGTFLGIVTRPTANDVLFAAGKLSDTDKKLLAPSDADIVTSDRVEIDSVTYDLYGTLEDWTAKPLNGTTRYMRLFLKRVVG